MTQIGLLGDLHGSTAALKVALETFRRLGIQKILQAGDFGIYPTSDLFLKLARITAEKNDQTIYITPGNHEDWDWINELHAEPRRQREDGWTKLRGDRLLIAPRGLRWEWDGISFLSLGGAPSVDRGWRVRQQGANPPRHKKLWHEGEAITLKDASRVVLDGPVDVMIAHDAPYGVETIERRIAGNPLGFEAPDLIYARDGRDLMRQVVDSVQPHLFVHGHYHFPVFEQTRLAGGDWMYILGLDCELNRSSMGIFDTETLEARFVDWRQVMA